MEKSDGMFEDTCLTSRIEDFKAALQFLHEDGKVDINKIGVIGSSFGGMVAITARDERIKAIVAISTPIEISGLGKPQPSKGPSVKYVLPSGRKLKTKFYEDLQKYDLVDAVNELVPVEHALKLYEAAHEPKE